jgi:hypothetical protein
MQLHVFPGNDQYRRIGNGALLNLIKRIRTA